MKALMAKDLNFRLAKNKKAGYIIQKSKSSHGE
jgi:hypothetical protein